MYWQNGKNGILDAGASFKTSPILMKNFMRLLFFFIGLILYSCATPTETRPCNDLDGSCTRAADAKLSISPSEAVALGTLLTADASESVQDETFWFLDNVSVVRCNQKSVCVFEMNTTGVFSVKLKVTVKETSVKPATEDVVIVDIVVGCGELGSPLQGGILIQEDEDACVVMETQDRAECRPTDYSKCESWYGASALCEAGVTSGTQWYLPGITELESMYAQAENNGICTNRGASCAEVETRGISYTPFAYWSSTIGSHNPTAYWVFDFSIGSGWIDEPNNSARAVRCVKRIPFE